jgi:membrane fusion protein, heavy metal efflux system
MKRTIIFCQLHSRHHLLLLFFLLLLLACGTKKTPAIEEKKAVGADETIVLLTDTQLKNAGIQTGKASSQAIASLLKVNGKIDVPPQNMVSISFPLGGYLKSTKLLPGMHVRKGEVLAVLEDPQYIQLQQDYLVAKAKLIFLEPELQRQKELNTEKAASDKILQQTQSDYQAQHILVKSLKEKLRLIGINTDKLSEENITPAVNLYSPIDGFVSMVHVNIGKYVSPTEVLFDLVNPQDIHLNLTVFEKDIHKLSIGQQVLAYTNDQPDEKHPADIILIGKDLGDQRAVEVHCHFDRYNKNLLPGMYMNAEIKVTNVNALAVPEGAVVRWQNEHFVFVRNNQHQFALTKVQTGVTEKGMIEITSPDALSEKEIVLQNAYALLMKMKNTAEE